MKNSGRIVMTLVVVAFAVFTYYWYKIRPNQTVQQAAVATQGSEGAAQGPAGRDLEGYFPKDTFIAVKLDLAAMADLGQNNGWKDAATTADLSDYTGRVVAALDPEFQTLVHVLSGYVKGEIMLGVMPPPKLSVETTLSLPAVVVAQVDASQSVGLPNALRTAYRRDFPERSEVLAQESPEIFSIATRKAKLYCSWQETTGLLMASMDMDLLQKTLARRGAMEGSITQNSEYAQINKKFAQAESGRTMLLVFCDAKTTVDNWYAYMERQGRVDTLREKQYYDLKRVIDGLGVTGVRGLALLVQSASDGARTTRYVDLGGKYEGIFKLLAPTGNESLAAATLVPADMAAFTAAVVQVGPAWDAVKKAMTQVGGTPNAAFNRMLDAFNYANGVSLDDLVYELGNEVAVAYDVGRADPSLVLLRAKSDRSARLLTQMAERLGLAVNRRSMSHGPVYSVGAGASSLPFSKWPAFTYKEPFMYLADSAATLERVFAAQASGQVMAGRDDFKALSGKLAGERHYLSFVTPDFLLTASAHASEGLFNLGLVRGLPVDFSPQKPLLEPCLVAGQYAGEGLVVRSVSQKGGDLGLAGMLALGKAPDVLRLRERYQIMLLQQRLAMIDEGKQRLAQMYGLTTGTPVTADGEGKNTYDLLTAGLLGEQPMCPFTHQPLIVNPVGTPATSPLFQEQGQESLQAMIKQNMQATDASQPSALRRQLVDWMQMFMAAPGT